jgi:hypothetical protein
MSLVGNPTVVGVATASPIVVAGLVSQTPYQCSVIATNAIGPSLPSATLNVIWPSPPTTGGGNGDCRAIPTAPSKLSTAPGNASATVSWAPAIGCVAGYVVTPYLGSVAQVSTLIPGNGTTTVVEGLTNGLTYRFTVAAENGLVLGPASTLTGSITAGAPSPVTVLRAARVARGAVKLTFTKPASNGAPITKYLATCASINGGKVKTKTGKASPLTMTGLTPGKTYRCTVKATNSRGAGPASKASAAVKV